MRLLSLAAVIALLVLPIAAAATPPILRQCTQLGCVIVQDTDGDGDYDWANVATSVDHALTLNANLHEGALWVAADASTEETTDPYHALVILLLIDTDGGVRTVWFEAEAYEGDEETGEMERILFTSAVAQDGNGDGVPDHVIVVPPRP